MSLTCTRDPVHLKLQVIGGFRAVWVGFAFLVFEVAAIACALRAVLTARTAQGAVAWAVFLLTLPFISVPAYLVFGHSKFAHYRIVRRDSAKAVKGLSELGRRWGPEVRREDLRMTTFETLARMPVLGGNEVKLLIDGDASFDAMFEAIDEAKSYILVQFYIFRDDQIGRQLRDKLVAAALRGVKVRLLYDAIGCFRLSNRYLASLRDAGVIVMDIHRKSGPQHRFEINFRNHRKTVVVDSAIAFTGGLNVGDEYLGRSARFGAWRDTFLRIEGPTALQLQLVFLEDWHWATGELLGPDLDWTPALRAPDTHALILPSGPGDEMETGALYFCAIINASTTRCWIASPYFVPDRDVLSALKLASLRGVDVKILVPDQIDHHTVWLAAFAYFDEVIEAGVEVWRYDEGFMHQKVILIDDQLASIGTFNMDNRSFRLNFEATALVFDKALADEVRHMLEADFARAFLLRRRLSEQRPVIRYGAPVARLFAPVL